MSAEEAYREKQRFIADAERRLRRRLSEVERSLLTLIFERIINRLDIDDQRLTNTPANQNLLNTLGTIHREFTKPANVKVVADFARTAMGLPVRGGRYFGSITGETADRIKALQRMAEDLLRAKLGLTDTMNLKAGGYLQTVIEDVTVRNKLRAIVSRAIEEGGHLTSLRTSIREYLIGTKATQGALTRQAEGQLFDTLMDVDRASDLAMANDLELQGAVYVGGLIETTRTICCELDTKAWTRAEMDALNEQARNGNPWSGYKGDIEIYCGGWNCRHGWRWVTNSALMRMRADLEIVPGTKKVRYRDGVPQQMRNGGCEGVKKSKRLPKLTSNTNGGEATIATKKKPVKKNETFVKQEFNEDFDHAAGVREMFAEMGYSDVKVKVSTTNGLSIYVTLTVAILNRGKLYADMFVYEDFPVTITVRISDHASGLSRAGQSGDSMTLSAFKHLIETGAIARTN